MVLLDMVSFVVDYSSAEHVFFFKGLMKISELSVSFQDANISMINNISILLRLLQKFDLAITWDNQHLIFPPLLPTQLSINTIVSRMIFFRLNMLHPFLSVRSLSCINHLVIECD